MGVQMKRDERKRRNLIFILAIFSSAVYLFWRIFFTIPWHEGIFSAAAGVLLVLAELLYEEFVLLFRNLRIRGGLHLESFLLEEFDNRRQSYV